MQYNPITNLSLLLNVLRFVFHARTKGNFCNLLGNFALDCKFYYAAFFKFIQNYRLVVVSLKAIVYRIKRMFTKNNSLAPQIVWTSDDEAGKTQKLQRLYNYEASLFP